MRRIAALAAVMAIGLVVSVTRPVQYMQIYRGSLVSPGQYVAVVGLTYRNVATGRGERTPRCTGTLIAANAVLSAGHCICEAQDAGLKLNAVYFGFDPAKVDPGASGYYFPVKKAWAKYDCRHPNDRDGNDFAIIVLDRKVDGVKPVTFAANTLFDTVRKGRIAGFGATDASGTVNDFRKRQASVTILSLACRSAIDQNVRHCIGGRELVAGAPNAPDTCSGDSGAPLLVSTGGIDDTDDGNDLTLLGVTSRSLPTASAVCGVGGIYERVDVTALTWIADQLRAL